MRSPHRPAIAFGSGSLAEAGVRQMLGSVDRGHVVGLVDALAACSGEAVVAQVDALRGLGLSAAGTLEDLAQLMQQMALVQAVPAALDDADPETAEVRRLQPAPGRRGAADLQHGPAWPAELPLA